MQPRREEKLTWFSFLNELKYTPRKQICDILNCNAKWKELAGELGYTGIEVDNFGMACMRAPGWNSPADDLLSDWSHRQPTLDHLYKKLKKLRFNHAATILKQCVDGNTDEKSDSDADSDESSESSQQETVTELPVPSVDSLPIPVASDMGNSPLRKRISQPPSAAYHAPRREIRRPLENGLDTQPKVSAYNQRLTQSPQQTGRHTRPKVWPCNQRMTPVPQQNGLETQPKEYVTNQQLAAQITQQKMHRERVPVSQQGHPMSVHLPQKPGYTYDLGQVTSDSQNEFVSVQKVPTEQIVQGSTQNSESSADKTFDKSLHLNLQTTGPSSMPDVTHRYHYGDIKKATYGFAEELIVGHGSFGTDYRGVLRNAGVAIKRITPKSQRDARLNMKMMSSEVENLLNIRHPRLVLLDGYSADGEDFCLVSELLEHGSLQSLLAKKDSVLQPTHRLNILRGAAEGLNYLHLHTPESVLHGSLKSCNILVDKHFEAKLSDFGLARFVAESTEGVEGSHINRLLSPAHCDLSQAYLAPENEVSMEGDVYSFGVVVFECCTGEKPVDERREGARHLKVHIDNSLSVASGSCRSDTSKLLQFQHLCDPFLKGVWKLEQWDSLLGLGIMCTANRKGKRPQIGQVLEKLKDLSKESANLQREATHMNMLNGPVLGSADIHKLPLNVQPPAMNHSPLFPPSFPMSSGIPMQACAPLRQPYIDPRLQMSFGYAAGTSYLSQGVLMQSPPMFPPQTLQHHTGIHLAHPNAFTQPVGYHDPNVYSLYPASIAASTFMANSNPQSDHLSYMNSIAPRRQDGQLYGIPNPPNQGNGMPYQQQPQQGQMPYDRHPSHLVHETVGYKNKIAPQVSPAEMNKMKFDRQADIPNAATGERLNLARPLNAPELQVPNTTPNTQSNHNVSAYRKHTSTSSSVQQKDTSRRSVTQPNSARIHNVILGSPAADVEKALPVKDLNIKVEKAVDCKVKTDHCKEASEQVGETVKLELDLKLEEDDKSGVGSTGNLLDHQWDRTASAAEDFSEKEADTSKVVCTSADSVVGVMEKPFPLFVKYDSQSSSSEKSDDEDDISLTSNPAHMSTLNTEDITVKKWPSFMGMESMEDSNGMVPRGVHTQAINKWGSLDFKAIRTCDKYRRQKQQNGQHKNFALLYPYNNLKCEVRCLSDPCLGSYSLAQRNCTLSGPQTCSLPTDSPAIYT